MPHIIAQGTDTDKGIQDILIHAEVTFHNNLFKSDRRKCNELLQEIANALNDVIARYDLPLHEEEILSNHEYNTLTK